MTEENRNASLNGTKKKRLFKEAVREGDPEACSWCGRGGGAAKSKASAPSFLCIVGALLLLLHPTAGSAFPIT